ncbi:MAG: cytochrome c-type biogenesis protein [Litorimonas sp.]
MLSLLLMLLPASALAQMAEPFEALPEQTVSLEVETRARALGRTLRCVVCQNESIEESDAPLAADMRVLVRHELMAGRTEAEVTAMMRDRYGDYVLLRPPVQMNTLVLWFGPLVAVIAGLFWFLSLRRKRSGVAPDALSDEERARLDQLRPS